jgi:hypothetical protein
MFFFNGLEHFLTFITGLLCIRISAAVTLYWFSVRHFRCQEFNPIVIWIWNQNIAISTIVGTSSHIIFNKLVLGIKKKIRFMYTFVHCIHHIMSSHALYRWMYSNVYILFLIFYEMISTLLFIWHHYFRFTICQLASKLLCRSNTYSTITTRRSKTTCLTDITAR